MHCRDRWLVLVGIVMVGLASTAAEATPQFARAYGLSCTSCHTVAPALNERGLAFEARGYQMERGDRAPLTDTIPLAMWITGRHERNRSAGWEETFLNRVELISGGPITDDLAYFLEWRAVSFETRGDGSLRDRSGRFEDAFVSWEFLDRHTLTVGQHRSLQQVDVSRRLSLTEPAAFSTSVEGDRADRGRIESLRAFAPSGRSPSITYEWQSIEGERPSDGLFHIVSVPFVGELSAPLTRQARREASFDLRADEPKGLYLETFYRQGLSSIGAHAFVDDDRYLLTGVGRLNIDNIFLTAAVGVDDHDRRRSRIRSSFEAEYHFVQSRDDVVRPAIGARVEHVTRTEPGGVAFSPYLAVSGPHEMATLLLQVQYRFQRQREGLFVDLSILF